MESNLLAINFIANLVLSFAFVLFIIFLFGRTNSKVYRLPWYKAILVKFGLCCCSAGALLNVFTFSNPPWTEVVLNTGLAMTFSWASWFHYVNFVIPYKDSLNSQPPTRKKVKQNTRRLTKV